MSLCRLIEKSYLAYGKKNANFGRDKISALSSLTNYRHRFVLKYFKNPIQMSTNGNDLHISGKKKKCRLAGSKSKILHD